MVNHVKQTENLSDNLEKKTGIAKAASSQTLIRGLDIIEAVSAGAVELADIARMTGITYSTAHRIVSALAQRHYLRRDPILGYKLGRKLLELGFHAYSEVELTRIARPILQDLADQTADTVHLATEEQGWVIYLDKLSSRRALEISSRIGGSKPLISTGVGKALLLDAGEARWALVYDQQHHLWRNPLPKSDWLSLMHEYARAGYAYDNGDDEPFIRCVAAPIYDASRKCVAAISVSSTLEYMDEQRMKSLVPVVCEAARKISIELGG